MSGFTLMELMVVIALIGITLFLTLPRLRAGLAGEPTLKTARQIIYLAQQLRSEALSKQKEFMLQIDLDEQRFGFSVKNDVEKGEPDGSDKGPLSHHLTQDVRITDVVFPPNGKVTTGRINIGFYRQGYADQALVHIENTSGDQVITLMIEPFLPHIQINKGYYLWEK